MATLSLRARLLAGIAIVVVVLVAVAAVVTNTTRTNLLGQVDEQLQRVADSAATRALVRPRDAPPPGSELRGRSLSDVYLAAVDGDELVVFAAPGLGGDDPSTPELSIEQIREQAVAGRPFTVGSAGNGPDYRALVHRDPRSAQTIVIAQPISDVDEAVRRLLVVEVTGTLLVVMVLSLVTWWVLRLGVRPIRRMTSAASQIAGGDLASRVPTADAGSEAAELGDALNQMLERIESAFDAQAASEERLRRFVADASHELRTPVTTIRGYCELYRRGGLDDPGELTEAMRRTEQESVRMGNLVGDMLQLARLDQGRALASQPLRLDQLVSDAARDAAAVQPTRPITVEVTEVTVDADEDRLRQVLSNVVGNALVHTDEDVALHLRLELLGDTARIEVHDDGPGMTAVQSSLAFERFYRADPSRSRHQGGSGLGLAIVKALVEAFGGSVELHSDIGEGTTVVISLPTAAASPD